MFKLGLHLNANATEACRSEARQGKIYSTFVHCLTFAKATNRPCINVLNVSSLRSTDSQWIAFGCLPNIHHRAKCCLPRCANTSTLNNRFIFACCIHILFLFRCKPGFRCLWVIIKKKGAFQ